MSPSYPDLEGCRQLLISIMPTQPSKSGQGAETEIQPRGWRIGGLLYSACIRVLCRGVDFRIGNSSALLPDHFSVSDGALFIILIKTTGQYFILQYLASKLNSIACDIDTYVCSLCINRNKIVEISLQ